MKKQLEDKIKQMEEDFENKLYDKENEINRKME